MPIRSSKIAWIVCILTACSSLKVFAIARHPEAISPESAYLQYSENFPYVGGMFHAGADGEFNSFSSGVLIDEHWVLTSGHGVLENENCPSCIEKEFLFVLGPTTYMDVLEYKTTTHVYLHPGYRRPEDGVDLALLYFEEAFTSVTPATLSTYSLQAGDEVSIVGFGLSGLHFGNPDPMSNGIRRGSINVVGSTLRYDGYASYDWASFREADFRPLGGQLIPGDSGGGWFVDNGNGHELVAITSGGSGWIAYGQESTGRMVKPSLNWIADTISSIAVPEPHSVAIILAALPPLFAPRRIRFFHGQT